MDTLATIETALSCLIPVAVMLAALMIGAVVFGTVVERLIHQ